MYPINKTCEIKSLFKKKTLLFDPSPRTCGLVSISSGVWMNGPTIQILWNLGALGIVLCVWCGGVGWGSWRYAFFTTQKCTSTSLENCTLLAIFISFICSMHADWLIMFIIVNWWISRVAFNEQNFWGMCPLLKLWADFFAL